eukprot:1388797-Amorphochlora_amoeboformis.AAC.1
MVTISLRTVRFPPQQELRRLMIEEGFSSVEYENLSAGIVAIHSGCRGLLWKLGLSAVLLSTFVLQVQPGGTAVPLAA